MKLRRTLPLLLVALVSAALLAPATSSGYVVGIAEQHATFFNDPYLQQLAPTRTRYITPYDSVFKDRDTVDEWMGAARQANMEIVVAFNPPDGMRCPNIGRARGCRPVSGAAYKRAFLAFRKRYPYVRIYQPWNEVNNLTQPTARYPEAVVSYYQIVKANCPGCTVLGADLQDLPNMVSYATRVMDTFRRRRVRMPQLWGLHNYTDINRFVKDRNSSLRRAARLLPGKIWLTETAGLFRFQPQNARQSFRPDLQRQKRAMEAIYKQANLYRNKVARIYLYQWYASVPSNRWDSGVLDNHNRPRPVYSVLERYRAYFR